MMAGAMKRSRTSGLRLRRPALSPSELPPRVLHVQDTATRVWSRQWDSNPHRDAYKAPARPIELYRRVGPEEGSEAMWWGDSLWPLPVHPRKRRSGA